MKTENTKRISSKPFFFGLEKLFFKKEILSVDEENLHVESKLSTCKFPLSCITSIKKTNNKVNNRMIWEIELRFEDGYKCFRFMHNYTIWNSNFPDFLTEMKEKYPEVVKSKFNIFGM